MKVDPLIPLRDAIGMAGMRTTKAYQEIAAGRLYAIRNGRRTFIRASEIERYITALEQSDTSSKPRKVA